MRAAWLQYLLAGLLFLQPLSTDLYQAALPAIGTGLRASTASVQVTMTVFLLVFGLWQFAAGPLSDRFGRRPVILTGLATYVGASAVCALAPSMPWLILGRAGQAFGACSCLVCARAIVRDAFEPSQGARLLAASSTIFGALALLCPFVGGLLVTWFDWRVTFTAMLVASSAVALAALITLRETNQRRSERLRITPLVQAYGVVLRTPTWHAYTWPLVCSNAAVFGFLSGGAFVLIGVLGVEPVEFGLCYSLIIVGYILGTLLCRQILPRLGMQRAMIAGASQLALASILMASLALADVRHWSAIVLPHFLYMIGHGQIHPIAMAGSVARFPQSAGTAAAAMGAAIMLAAAAIGQWIGFAVDGTTSALPLAMAACGLCAASAVFLLIHRYGNVD